MARSTNAKRRPASARQQLDAKGVRQPSTEDGNRSDSSASMALTTTSSTTADRRGSSSSPFGSARNAATTVTSSVPLLRSTTEKPSPSGVLTVPPRKRARGFRTSHSGSASNERRSPSASAITEGLEGATRGTRSRYSATQHPRPLTGSKNSPHHRSQDSAARLADSAEDDEVFFEASSRRTGTNTAAATPLRHLQDTPTSQLLSQLQDLPYTAPSDEITGEETAAAALFTPATVARRRTLPTVAGEGSVNDPRVGEARDPTRRTTAASLSPSGSRSSVHDEAVQAILRANPPTTTRPVELKPGYRIPSPHSPLWAALDASDVVAEDRPMRGSTRSEDEPQWSNTQVSLFQEDEDERDTGVAHDALMEWTAVQERRRLGTRRAAPDRVSLPVPGRSVNLLDDEGLHEDERLPLFLGEQDTPIRPDGDAAADESFVFSLTQEADNQEREQDRQAALPRSRNRRTTTGAAAAAATTNAFSTPSPARRSTRTRFNASQQSSPFTQLQRDVALASKAAVGRSSSSSPVNAAAANPSTMLSQREQRRRADMLKWAEHTRAFFHFIDSLPLHVSNSPLKPASALNPRQQPPLQPSTSRRSRSQSIAAVSKDARRSGGTVAASLSLVRRSHSTVVPDPVTRHGSAAFAAVVSRVKREAATASKQQQQHQQRRSATAASRGSAP